MPENQSFLILTNESIFKNSEEIRIEMTFDGSRRQQKKRWEFIKLEKEFIKIGKGDLIGIQLHKINFHL